MGYPRTLRARSVGEEAEGDEAGAGEEKRGWGETSTDLQHRLDYSPSDDGALAGREGN